MFRIRFKTKAEDPRPVSWPIDHPYWVTGAGSNYHTLVSYADDIEYIRQLWPEAYDLDPEYAEGYVFTERFPKPEWFDERTMA